jgi:hypothetical protein
VRVEEKAGEQVAASCSAIRAPFREGARGNERFTVARVVLDHKDLKFVNFVGAKKKTQRHFQILFFKLVKFPRNF